MTNHTETHAPPAPQARSHGPRKQTRGTFIRSKFVVPRGDYSCDEKTVPISFGEAKFESKGPSIFSKTGHGAKITKAFGGTSGTSLPLDIKALGFETEGNPDIELGRYVNSGSVDADLRNDMGVGILEPMRAQPATAMQFFPGTSELSYFDYAFSPMGLSASIDLLDDVIREFQCVVSGRGDFRGLQIRHGRSAVSQVSGCLRRFHIRQVDQGNLVCRTDRGRRTSGSGEFFGQRVRCDLLARTRSGRILSHALLHFGPKIPLGSLLVFALGPLAAIPLALDALALRLAPSELVIDTFTCFSTVFDAVFNTATGEVTMVVAGGAADPAAGIVLSRTSLAAREAGNFLRGGRGADILDGGAGRDVALLTRPIPGYTFTDFGAGFGEIAQGRTDLRRNMEDLRLAQGTPPREITIAHTEFVFAGPANGFCTRSHAHHQLRRWATRAVVRA